MDDIKIETVQNDTVVLLDYTLTVDGEEIDKGPIQYLHGHNNIISGLEDAITGMRIGESKDVYVAALDAYGEYDEKSVVKITRESFPADFKIVLGEPMRVRDESGHVFSGVVTALSETDVEFDMNHPLAGKDLQFKTTILDLRPATSLEIQNGNVQSGCEGCGSHGCGDSCCG